MSSPAKKTPASYISASTKVPGTPMSGITNVNSTMNTKSAVKARLASGAEVEGDDADMVHDTLSSVKAHKKELKESENQKEVDIAKCKTKEEVDIAKIRSDAP